MSDTDRTVIKLERGSGDRFWTLSSTFIITNSNGQDIYYRSSAIVLDREGLERVRDLVTAALKTS